MSNHPGSVTRPNRLAAIKTAHAVVWAFFVACIAAIPLASWHGYHGTAAGFIAIVLAEVAALAFNNWTCPLTVVARRYTDDRSSNFDIYLPEWIAKYNKQIFGPSTSPRWLLQWCAGPREKGELPA